MEIFQMGSDLPPLILASYGTGGAHFIYGGHMGHIFLEGYYSKNCPFFKV